MRITLQLHEVPSLRFPEAKYNSENLVIWGQIDRLHSPGAVCWLPKSEEVEEYLKATSDYDLLPRLRGIEGQYLAIWRKAGHCYIFCDPFALQPIYYRIDNISIEIFDKILGRISDLTIDHDCALAFLLLRFVPGRRTLFKGITRFMPGDCLIIDTRSGDVRIENCLAYPHHPEMELDSNGIEERLHSLFREALEKRLQQFSADEPFFVPVSGGIDSRYVLATTLELVPAQRIVCMTYGTPGSFDFEIGKAAATAVGVRHVACPLSPRDYRDDLLIDNCMDADGQISFTTEPPLWVYSRLAENGRVILSGYVGDAITGKKKRAEVALGHKEVLLKDAICSAKHDVCDIFPLNLLDESFFYDENGYSVLGPEELWFFLNHFTKYSSYCVFKLRHHFTFISPFVDRAFLDTFLHMPNRHQHRHVYISMLANRFPGLASIPCKSFHGLPLTATQFRKHLAYQCHRLSIHLMNDRRSLNTIDFKRFEKQILGEKIYSIAKKVLRPEFLSKILKKEQLYLIRYNLKCLELLEKDFGVHLN